MLHSVLATIIGSHDDRTFIVLKIENTQVRPVNIKYFLWSPSHQAKRKSWDVEASHNPDLALTTKGNLLVLLFY